MNNNNNNNHNKSSRGKQCPRRRTWSSSVFIICPIRFCPPTTPPYRPFSQIIGTLFISSNQRQSNETCACGQRTNDLSRFRSSPHTAASINTQWRSNNSHLFIDDCFDLASLDFFVGYPDILDLAVYFAAATYSYSSSKAVLISTSNCCQPSRFLTDAGRESHSLFLER